MDRAPSTCSADFPQYPWRVHLCNAISQVSRVEMCHGTPHLLRATHAGHLEQIDAQTNRKESNLEDDGGTQLHEVRLRDALLVLDLVLRQNLRRRHALKRETQ